MIEAMPIGALRPLAVESMLHKFTDHTNGSICIMLIASCEVGAVGAVQSAVLSVAGRRRVVFTGVIWRSTLRPTSPTAFFTRFRALADDPLQALPATTFGEAVTSCAPEPVLFSLLEWSCFGFACFTTYQMTMNRRT